MNTKERYLDEHNGKLFTSVFKIDKIYKRIDKLAQYEKQLGFGDYFKPIFMRVRCIVSDKSYNSNYNACHMYVETITLDGHRYEKDITQGAYFTLLKDIELTCIDSNNYSLLNLFRAFVNSK